MNEPMDIEVIRTEALRKLGRNIVNFSKIEGALKYLLSVSQFEGDKETISEQLSRNQDKLRKQTLGNLVKKFHENVVVDASQLENITDSSSLEISFQVKVSSHNSDSLKAMKRALSNIVDERNRLIHEELALLDTSCVEDYRKLISLLDEQNPRLLAQLKEIGWIIESAIDTWKTFEDLIKSPDFRQYIQSGQTEI